MALNRASINVVKDVDLRNVLLQFFDQVDFLNQVNGVNFLNPVNNSQPPASAPPPQAKLAVAGSNGNYTIQVTNPAQAANKTLWHEISYSTVSNFTSSVTTMPVTTATQQSVSAPGANLNFRLRSSYDGKNWNNYTILSGAIAAGLQSSEATENNVPLNQTNYANVDSVAVGATANVRVYGTSGPGTSYPSVKGASERIQPSATIIGARLNSNLVVAFDGTNYQVRNTLPEVFADGNTPTGSVSVVGAGGVTLPAVDLVLGTGGTVLAWNVTSQGNGLTAPVTLSINTATGSGATPGAQTIQNGKLISISPGNPGSGYASGDTVTVSGGVFSGASGGGQHIGGNGGRFVYNDGTTGAAA